MPGLEWSFLGCVDYAEARQIQGDHAQRRARGEGPDLLLTLEHPPIFTIGRSGAARTGSAIVARADAVQCVPVERAGGPTYHGPGQLVAYPVIRLAARGRAVRGFVAALEGAVLETCEVFGAAAVRRQGFPGVWSADGVRKIASIGLAIWRGVTLHGAALNLDERAERGFDAIDPCGLVGVRVTSIASEARRAAPSCEAAAIAFARALARRLDADECRRVDPNALRERAPGRSPTRDLAAAETHRPSSRGCP